MPMLIAFTCHDGATARVARLLRYDGAILRAMLPLLMRDAALLLPAMMPYAITLPPLLAR